MSGARGGGARAGGEGDKREKVEGAEARRAKRENMGETAAAVTREPMKVGLSKRWVEGRVLARACVLKGTEDDKQVGECFCGAWEASHTD